MDNVQKTALDFVHPVLLCGGAGSRLWPLSRKSLPKQFVQIIGKDTLFSLAMERIIESGLAKPLIVASEDHRFHVQKEVKQHEVHCDILLEPLAHNTAPSIIIAALYLKKQGHRGLMLVLPSDHLMPDTNLFRETIKKGVTEALAGSLVTFGILPDRCETGYGYLKIGSSNDTVKPVLSFHEKPPLEVVKRMLSEGDYLWNSGMFLIGIDELLSLAADYQPAMLAAIEDAAYDMRRDDSFVRPNLDKWLAVPTGSIDYAIVEKCDRVACVPFSGNWSDLGHWNSVFAVAIKDDEGNRLRGASTVIDCTNTSLWSNNEKTQLVGLGLNEILVVATDDAIMVADASRTQEVRKIVSELENQNISQAHQHSKDYRPWGWFESLEITMGYQVKRLYVEPGARLSLQSHKHRSEHWVVVSGTATVVINDLEMQVNPNESVYIDIGDKHRLANNTTEPVIVIEIQLGTYLGEDDIVRYEDDFFRA